MTKFENKIQLIFWKGKIKHPFFILSNQALDNNEISIISIKMSLNLGMNTKKCTSCIEVEKVEKLLEELKKKCTCTEVEKLLQELNGLKKKNLQLKEENLQLKEENQTLLEELQREEDVRCSPVRCSPNGYWQNIQ